MKKTFAQFGIAFSKTPQNYIRIVLFLLTLAMLVLGHGYAHGSGEKLDNELSSVVAGIQDRYMLGRGQ